MHGEPMTTFVLGPEGTFSHELAERLSCRPLQFAPTIRSLMAAVARGEGDGIVPIENSEAGGVGETLDGLMRLPLFITEEMYMPIRHHLAALVPLGEIEVIYLHPQTHEQCSEHLEAWGKPVVHTSSNAAGALEVKKNRRAAAILPAIAAQHYAIPILVQNVENSAANTTRFVRISATPAPAGGADKCSFLIDPATDRAGLLHDLLEVFAQKMINLSRIESRPSKRGMGSYVFFLDTVATPAIPAALAELRTIAAVKELGCYKRREVPV
jgi:prephenate dehydratase